ncbi:MAG: hypothetical protein KIT31_11825 [Deltaproteobacteria bacterium]|nr:hypothetical protein [Deltaproteobacteria bacterium]
MTRLLAHDVFNPTGYPTYTYVTRDQLHHERLLRQWVQSSTQIASVSGPSKAGKTVLVQRVVGAGNLVTVSGASVRAPDQLWERVLDWWGEPHALTASHVDTTGEGKSTDRGVSIGLSGTGGTHRTGNTATSGASDTTQATVNRRGLPQVVQELADSAYTLLLDDFHYIPAAIQSDVAQQLKDAASRGVRICVASVPHRADNVVRALPELRGRVLAIDLDYWNRHDLLEIPRLGFKHLGVTIDEASLAAFAIEAAGSPQLMQSICRWMCEHLGVRERADPARSFTLEAADRKEILFLTTCTVEFRSLVHALVQGPRARPGERKKYQHRDGKKGDVYLTIMRAIAADPPRLSFEYAELTRRLEELCRGSDAPDGASVVRTCVTLGQIASGFAPASGPPSLEWDEQDQILVLPDPYLLFYLRWSNALDREAEDGT